MATTRLSSARLIALIVLLGCAPVSANTGLRVLPIAPGVVYGAYCYTVTQKDTTSSGVSERVFVRTPAGWRIALTTAFGLPAGASAQCK